MKSLKQKSGIKRKNCYKSIYDLPMYNWIEMRRNKDFTFLIKDKNLHKEEIDERSNNNLYDLYLDLLTEFYKEFGQSKQFRKELELMLKIVKLNLKFAETQDRFIVNSINILKDELANLRANEVDKKLNVDDEKRMKQEIAFVCRTLGKPIDIRKITVLQFYTQLSISQASLN